MHLHVSRVWKDKQVSGTQDDVRLLDKKAQVIKTGQRGEANNALLGLSVCG
jgi:hypothetical protein